MGNQQSSAEGAGSATSPATVVRKTCYYELLGVDRSADDLEIRRAYKKKALELHPDRNFNDEENATKKFAEVQTAYEVLSDPQERAWYDSHRDAILCGDDDAAAEASAEFYNIRITTTEEIMNLIGRFNSNVPFNDSPAGFFGVLDTTFGQLATEEAAACGWAGLDPIVYPPFGKASDDHESTARPFYAAWSTFSTKKSFSWKDKWRLTDAPDRSVRRLMEKENKKLREDAIRDFNDAVRSLVAFVKKRDPRYVTNTQSEADRQKILRDLAAAQAARSRAANQEKLKKHDTVVAEWVQSRDDGEGQQDEFATSSEDAESEVECFECVVCNKLFKSEKQLEAHEKSKKHIKAVQQLRRQMQKEGRDLDLEKEADPDRSKAGKSSSCATGTEQEAETANDMDEGGMEEQTQSESAITQEDNREEIQEPNEESASTSSSEDTLNDEYAARDVVESRLASESIKVDIFDGEDGLVSKITSVTLNKDDDDDDDWNNTGGKKLGKAKAKRAKKADKQQQQQQQAQENTLKCGICNKVFDSKNKLFKHIKDQGHAELKTVVSQKGKTGKKAKR